MSEEKMYMVKDDEGRYWDFNDFAGFWELFDVALPITGSKEDAKKTAKEHGGHVVTLIEEPEKVVLTKEQSEIVENARIIDIPATYISDRTDEHNGEKILGEEILLIKALTNGYTVAKEKEYNVKVPKKWCGDDKYYWAKEKDGTLIWEWLINKEKNAQQFTMTEIEYYGLQDCEKVECERR